jgi:type IV secretion system protein VirB6
MACSAPSAVAPIVTSLADYLTCHASALGQNTFEGVGHGVFLTAMLTSCLIIYVALIGYRLMFGHPYTFRDAVVACVRVGLIVTFCTNWPSYEAVFYRTVVEGPQEIAGQMLQSSGLPLLNETDIAGRIQQDYGAVQTAANNRSETPPTSQFASISPQAPGVATTPPANVAQGTNGANGAPPPIAALTTPEVSTAGLVFLISTVGSLLAVRLAAALLMAIGPLIIVLALFDSLVGLLENWVAALAGTMLATAGIVIVTTLELGFIEARLSDIGDNGVPGLTDQGLLLTAALFSLCIVGVVMVAGLVGRRLKFSRLLPQGQGYEAQPARSFGQGAVSPQARPISVVVAPPSRASVVSNAVTEVGRRERMRLGAPAASTLSWPQALSRSEALESGRAASLGLGYSLRRTGSSSRSISYARRGQRQ